MHAVLNTTAVADDQILVTMPCERVIASYGVCVCPYSVSGYVKKYIHPTSGCTCPRIYTLAFYTYAFDLYCSPLFTDY